jgi:hypothetical protein
MFDSLPETEKESEREQVPNDGEKSSWWIGRWAHVIAMVFFAGIYFPFAERFWSWQLAITTSYIVFMLCCTCGMAFRDSDDFFGNLQVSQYLGKLLIRQMAVLVLVSIGAYIWHHLEHVLPDWIAQRGRRLSVWDMFGLVIAYVVAVREASWMAQKIKLRFPELEETF